MLGLSPFYRQETGEDGEDLSNLPQGIHYEILELVLKLRQFESRAPTRSLFTHFMCVHVYKEISQTYRNVQRLIKRIHCAYLLGLSSPQPFDYKEFHSQ